MTKKISAVFLVDGVQVSLRNLKMGFASADEFRKHYVSRAEVQVTLHISQRALQDWRRQGKLRVVKYSGRLYYNREDLAALLASENLPLH